MGSEEAVILITEEVAGWNEKTSDTHPQLQQSDGVGLNETLAVNQDDGLAPSGGYESSERVMQ